jgi:hypothetical protein
MISLIMKQWNAIPKPVQTWLKGLEVAILTGTVSALIAFPASDLTTKAGVVKFVGIVAAAAGACVRLYLKQSPIQNVVEEIAASRTVTVDGLAVKDSVSEKITQ